MKRSLFAVFTMLFASSVLYASSSMIPAANQNQPKIAPAILKEIAIPVKNTEKGVAAYLSNNFLPKFGISNAIKPVLVKKISIDGADMYKFSYTYKGIKVLGYTTVSVKDGEIYRINNSIGEINFDPSKLVPPMKAVESARKAMLESSMAAGSKHYSELVVMNYMDKFIPVYKVQFMPLSIFDMRIYFVDAMTGNVLYSANNIQFQEIPAPTDEAMVYESNPLRTPTPIPINLPWVSAYDDETLPEESRGFLLSAKDENGIRKIKSFNCPDKGEKITVDVSSMIPQAPAGTMAYIPFCSPTQLANKIENGNFIYMNGDKLDCETGNKFVKGEMTVEKIDRCAEISMYYHAAKIWEYLVSLNTGFDYLASTTAEKPLNVIGNGQIPDLMNMQTQADFMKLLDPNNDIPLAPFDNAVSIPANPMIDELFKQFGVAGDILMFFQGSQGDFGFDGDVVYHEFGHSTMSKTGLESMPYPDKYGVSNEPGSLHEGLADTFTFIMTNDACTGEYASKAIVDANPLAATSMDKDDDFYCMRYAEQPYIVFEDFIGEVHFDGQPMLAANWAIFKYMKENNIGEDLNGARDIFTKMIMKTLFALGTPKGNFKLWAETFMTELKKDDALKSHEENIKKIFEDFNFYAEVRARSAQNGVPRTEIGAASSGDSMMGASGITVEVNGKTKTIMPAYLEFYYDIPSDFPNKHLKVSAKFVSGGGMDMLTGGGATGGSPDVKLFARKSEPVVYSAGTVELDYEILENNAETANNQISYTYYIPDVEAGKKYYFQPVNYGAAGGTLTNIKVEGTDELPNTVNDDDKPADDSDMIADSDIVLDDNITDSDEINGDADEIDSNDSDAKSSPKEKKDDGCGCSII